MIFKKWENTDISLTVSLAAYLLARVRGNPHGVQGYEGDEDGREVEVQGG